MLDQDRHYPAQTALRSLVSQAGEIAFDSSSLEVKSLPALRDMHILAVDGLIGTAFRYMYRHYQSGSVTQCVATVSSHVSR